MTVTVKLFAILRDVAGVAEDRVTLSPGASAQDAGRVLAEKYPAMAKHLARAAYAVNRSYAPPGTPLREGDEVALIPPVSGG